MKLYRGLVAYELSIGPLVIMWIHAASKVEWTVPR